MVWESLTLYPVSELLSGSLISQVEELHQGFRKFEERDAKSELSKFFWILLQLVAIIKNAAVSGREETWNLLVATIEDSMPISAEFD